MTDHQALYQLAARVVEALTAAGKTLATAESCTGGWVAKALTDVAGSSGCFGYGFVTYSNGAKQSLLGVAPATLEAHGAVSEETVREMAQAALQTGAADIAVAVSGIAGPGGGTTGKPVGTVWFAWALRGSSGNCELAAEHRRLPGDRESVRAESVKVALRGVLDRVVGQEL